MAGKAFPCYTYGAAGRRLYVANPELVRTLDYILNRCDDKAIDAVAEAVVRRRRQLTMFGGNVPNPERMAAEISGQVNMGASIEGLRKTVQDMAIRIIKREAPELTDEQVAVLTKAWIPGSKGTVPGGAGGSGGEALPADLLFVMATQFVNYSLGRMGESEEKRLRAEMGDWPRRYWQALPEVVQLLIKDLIDGEIGEKEFGASLRTALSIRE
jgi:hypothetical protein